MNQVFKKSQGKYSNSWVLLIMSFFFLFTIIHAGITVTILIVYSN